jgi:predicted nucleic acid-binding protein
MLVVVSDTSPIRGLQCLGLLDLLGREFGQVLLPPQVAKELSQASRSVAPLDVSALPWCQVRAPVDQSRVREIAHELDAGEAEALVLALEMSAELILVDDFAARAEARRLGLRPMGLGGLLTRAKRSGHIAQVVPLMERVRREINFLLSDEVLDEIRRQAGE